MGANLVFPHSLQLATTNKQKTKKNMDYQKIIKNRLTVRELLVLSKMKSGATSPKEICDDQVSPALLTGITDKLIAKGLINRANHATDRRRYVYTITKAGKSLV